MNPHDISFSGMGWQAMGFPPVPDWVPPVAEAPSQADSLDERPACQAQFRAAWPAMLYPQQTDVEYRRLYHYLMALVDESIGRILASLDERGLADDTIVVLTSDHGDLLGAHGGLQQKWHNAYDEAIHVPMIVAGPGIDPRPEGLGLPTSHVDLVPTLLGLTGHDADDLLATVGSHHTEAHPLPGRDLSALLRGRAAAEDLATPVYFMTEDQISQGLITQSPVTQKPFDPVQPPSSIETVVAEVDARAVEAQPLLRRRRRQRRRGLGAPRPLGRSRGAHRSLGRRRRSPRRSSAPCCTASGPESASRPRRAEPRADRAGVGVAA